MRSLEISLISVCLTTAVVGNAYYQKKQFYPSVVYITKSNPSMAVIYIQSLVFVMMLGKLMRKVFLGTLRAAEFEHLMERFWLALTETCLAFTVFRDDFNPKFVALFTVLLFLKSFHWLAEDRVDYMERSPVIGWLFHVRVASLLILLASLDHLMISHAYESTVTKGATVQLVFGFEYAILITVVANTLIKYILHALEMRSDAPWDNKAVFLLYTELVIGLVRVILYILFVIVMVRLYTLPLFAFRPMYYTMRNFKKALNDVIMSRRAIRNMNTLYPDATPEELEMSDNICIICREDMINSSKKLPCGHIFHTACLRSWFQRQQTCPTCRLNILRSTPQPQQNVVQAAPQNAANQNNVDGNPAEDNVRVNDAIPNLQNLMGNMFTSTITPPTLDNIGGESTMPLLPHVGPMNFPSLACMPPYAIPPPPMPPSLDTLTEEELRSLEGTERHNVEERIKLLRNIQLMLDASVALMNQYNMIVTNFPEIIQLPNVTQPLASTSTIQNFDDAQASTSKESKINIEKNSTIAVKNCTSDNESIKINSVVTNESEMVKLEDVGSEDNLDTPMVTHIIEPNVNSVQIETVLDSQNNIDNEKPETAEIRRRRLQKFLQNESTLD